MKVFRKCIVRVKSSSPKVIFDCIDEPIWGVWEGLFGLANNEAIAITLSEKDEPSFWSDGVEVLDEERLLPTARPTSTDRPTKEGLYVFRSMHTVAQHVEEIVRLSEQAWQTFERDGNYVAEPVGLFKPEGPDDRCAMWLLTWYDGFESWQRSRSPHPEAKSAFIKRHSLLTSTSAIATRLLKP